LYLGISIIKAQVFSSEQEITGEAGIRFLLLPCRLNKTTKITTFLIKLNPQQYNGFITALIFQRIVIGTHIINHSFERFILSAEDTKEVEQWRHEASESMWKYLLAILTAVLGSIPLLFNSWRAVRGTSVTRED
jgi:hypothetical protein